MPAIGYVTKQTNGGYKGPLKTLSIRADIDVVPNAGKTADTQPDFRVVTQGVEIGAGWVRTGETSGKLVVFRQPGREIHVAFTPDPPRAAVVAVLPSTGLAFDAAVKESRKLFPTDTGPRAVAPEGNPQFVVERFSSPMLGQALGTADFSVIYTRDAKGAITSIVLGLGDDLDALMELAKK